uniref:Uncharacterized protein n=1 Tax=Anguilla anguilla TaxID=7936 RepID=A0A0E9QP01_ANGAN
MEQTSKNHKDEELKLLKTPKSPKPCCPVETHFYFFIFYDDTVHLDIKDGQMILTSATPY